MILIITGLIFVAIALSPVPREQILVNSFVKVDGNSSDTAYGFNAQYFLSGNGNGKLNGTLLTYQQCCVSFYIFTTSAWSNFMQDGYNVTSTADSPVVVVNSSALDSPKGISATFTFIPNPTQEYELVFFNDNRSLWHTNSSVVLNVIADVDLFYSQAPGRLLIYPGAASIVAGGVVIFVSSRFRKK
jgi:hypothetical protein